MAQVSIDAEKSKVADVKEKLPWYLIKSNHPCIQVFETIMAVPIVVTVVAAPMSLAFHDIYEIREGEAEKMYYGKTMLAVEFLWLIQICYNFFKVPVDFFNHKPNFILRQYIYFINNVSKANYPNPNESTLRTIARQYVFTYFVTDFLSVVPPFIIIIFFHDWSDKYLWIEILHLLRILRVPQIIVPALWLAKRLF